MSADYRFGRESGREGDGGSTPAGVDCGSGDEARVRHPGLRWKRLRNTLAFLPLLFLCGCGFIVDPPNGGGGGGTTTTNRAYVVNATTGTLSGFALGTGSLAALPGSPYALPRVPQAAVVSRNNNFLYVASVGTIDGYAIASDGSLSVLTCSGCAAIASVTSLDVSPDGQWLFGLDLLSATIDLWRLDSTTGALTQEAQAGYTITDATVIRKRVHVSPSGTLVVAALGTAGDVLVAFDTTSGTFGTTYTRLVTGSTQTSDNDAAFDSASTRLYVARSGGAGAGLNVYSISGIGLTPVSGSPFTTGATAASVTLDSKSTNVYVANSGDGTVTGYGIDAAGALTVLSGSPFPSGTGVNFLALDSTGGNLMATAAGGSPDLTVYTFDALTAGKLNASATSATGTDPAGAAGVALTH